MKYIFKDKQTEFTLYTVTLSIDSLIYKIKNDQIKIHDLNVSHVLLLHIGKWLLYSLENDKKYECVNLFLRIILYYNIVMYESFEFLKYIIYA